jgi:hypothetical protein
MVISSESSLCGSDDDDAVPVPNDRVEDVAPAKRSGPTPGSYDEESREEGVEEQRRSILTFVLSA